MLKDKFAKNPRLANLIEDEIVLKNFGFSKFADEDIDDEDMEEREIGIFDGTGD